MTTPLDKWVWQMTCKTAKSKKSKLLVQANFAKWQHIIYKKYCRDLRRQYISYVVASFTRLDGLLGEKEKLAKASTQSAAAIKANIISTYGTCDVQEWKRKSWRLGKSGFMAILNYMTTALCMLVDSLPVDQRTSSKLKTEVRAQMQIEKSRVLKKIAILNNA